MKFPHRNGGGGNFYKWLPAGARFVFCDAFHALGLHTRHRLCTVPTHTHRHTAVTDTTQTSSSPDAICYVYTCKQRATLIHFINTCSDEPHQIISIFISRNPSRQLISSGLRDLRYEVIRALTYIFITKTNLHLTEYFLKPHVLSEFALLF